MFSLVFAVIVCLSVVNAQSNTYSVFYPATLTETTCSNTYSWTMWFDTGSPNNITGDNENASVILSQYPRNMCLAPKGIEAQTVNYKGGSWNYGWQYLSITPLVQVVSFYSTTVLLDFRVRFCCPTGTFVTAASAK